jgi:Sulfotransferase domain
MTARISARARELFQHYAENADEYWPGVQVMQAEKLRSMIEQVTRAAGLEQDGVVREVQAMAAARMGRRPPPVYVTGLGGSGTNWLAAMLGDLDGFAYAGEVYFAPRLLERMASLSRSDQGYVADCIHLLHAWPRCERPEGVRVVNAASRAFEVGKQKVWDPGSGIVYMVREPRDQVLSVTFRKPRYRQLHGAGVSDLDYLALRCGSNRTSFEKFRRFDADFECRYEELREDTRGVLERLLVRIGAQAPPDKVAETVFRHDAANIRAGVVPRRGNLDEGGRARGWRADADPEKRWILHAELAEVVEGLGYDPDHCLGTPIALDPPEEARVLSFPAGDPVGELYFGDLSGSEPEWHRAGPARGRVEVPAGVAVRLSLGRSFDPKNLRSITLEGVGVQSLCLAGNPHVTDTTLKHLRGIGDLRELDLARTRVTDAAVEQLAAMASLQGLSLWKTRFTADGVDRLRDALPLARVMGPVAAVATLPAPVAG